MGQISKFTNMGQMRTDTNVRPETKSGIYKIYMPRDTLLSFNIDTYTDDILETKMDVAEDLVLAYIGVSVNLRSRIVSDHINGDLTASSFKRNISRFLRNESMDDINRIIDSCWVEWEVVEEKFMYIKEEIEIATHCTPLNRKGNKLGC